MSKMEVSVLSVLFPGSAEAVEKGEEGGAGGINLSGYLSKGISFALQPFDGTGQGVLHVLFRLQ